MRWIILALLFMTSFVAYILRTNMSIAGERVMTDLGLSKIQLGWVLALATGSVFAIIGVGLWLFVRADKPMTFRSK